MRNKLTQLINNILKCQWLGHSTLIILLLIIWTPKILTGQAFECNGELLLSQNQGNAPTSLYKIGLVNQTATFHILHQYNRGFNALGYNIWDGLLYATTIDGKIIRLKNDKTYDIIYSDPNLSRNAVSAGDVNYKGEYIIIDRFNGQLLFFNTIGNFRHLRTADLYYNPTGPSAGESTINIFSDIVSHPNDPNILIALQQHFREPNATKGYICFIDADINSPTVGMITPQFKTNPDVVLGTGALFVSDGGKLFAYGRNGSQSNPHDKLFEIDIENQSVLELGSGPSAGFIDGCSCPLPISFTKTIDTFQVLCDSIHIVYNIQIASSSQYEYFNLTLQDQLDKNGQFVRNIQIPSNASFTVDPSGQIINYNIPQLRKDDTLHFIFEIQIPFSDLPYSNQAKLLNLWPESNTILTSDDPLTNPFRDSTIIDSISRGSSGKYIVTEHLSMCPGDSIYFRNQWFSDTGKFVVNASSSNFCDTIIHVIIEPIENIQINIDTQFCDGDILIIENQQISSDTSFITFSNDIDGCDTIRKYTVSVVDWNTPSVTPISPCPDASDGQLILDPNSLDPNESFFWEDFSNDHSRDNLSSGSYSLTVINSLGCEKTFIYSLDELNIPSPQFQVQPADCHNDFQGRLIITNANGAHSFSVHQNPLLGDSAIVLDGPAIYHLKYLFEHCPTDTFFESTLIDTLQLTFDKDVVSDCGALVEVNARVLNADQNAIASFELIGIDSFEQSANDLHISFRAYHSQTVHAVVVDTHGCQYIRPISIDIDGEDHLFIPNVFTPNGDNINDEFHIYGSPCIQQINKFQIFDRWGEMVFAAYNFLPEEKGWNGQLNFEKMRPGTYTYYVVYESYAGGSFQRTGSVTILE